MRIGILGTGHVGMSLANGFARVGHEVTLGSRDPSAETVVAWAVEAPGRHAGTYREAAEFAEVVITALPGRLAAETIQSIGVDAFAGRLLIDTSNPVAFGPKGAEAVYPDDDSAAEHIQRLLPQTRVVKAFNQISAERMTTPEVGSGPDRMRICGNDAEAKRIVTELVAQFGWPVRDLGALSVARKLERGVIDWFVREAQGG
ncbi:MAG: NAD(P)-binding domain-containing protein [Coriobacteriia bacterium]|nr:NAD(P)-binding domain-containing protein [Coriobacteriia bacterium]